MMRRIVGIGLAMLVVAGLATWYFLEQGGVRGAARPALVVDGSVAQEFRSWGELKGGATIIAVVTAGSQRTQAAPTSGVPGETITSMQVGRVIWSRHGGGPTTVDVRQMGDATATVANYPLFTPGSQYLLFLVPNVLNPAEYFTVGAYQGVFKIDASGQVMPLSPSSVAGALNVHTPLATVAQAIINAPSVPTLRGSVPPQFSP